MPLYGQSEGANTLYVARASVPGDHGSTIAAFEPINVDDQRRLPPGESLVVQIGEPWLDVFLWNDAAYVGTAEQLWAELTPLHPDVEARAPLSLLELAVHAGRDEVSTLAGVALGFLHERFGEKRGRSWRRQFVRQQAEVALRRALADRQRDDAQFQAIRLNEATPNILTLDLPEELAADCSGDEVAASIARVSQLAAFLGASLAPLPVEKAAASVPVRPFTQGASSATLAPSVRDEAPVLVIAEGRRAREIVRHLRSKIDYEPKLFGPEWEILAGSKVELSAAEERRTGSVIALVLDEDEKEAAGLSGEIEEFLKRQAAAGALILLVPALPVTRPSIFLDPVCHTRLPFAHAILDTTIARSPFWWGNTKRSFDRRISDVLRLALAAAQSQVVRRELIQPRSHEAIPILSVGTISYTGDKGSAPDGSNSLRLGSEASWVTGDPKRSDPAVLFSVRINPDEVDGYRHDAQMIVEGRRRENRFPEFASAVIAPLVGRIRHRSADPWARLEQLSGLPGEIGETMRAPDYAAVFTTGGETQGSFRLVVTAETPSLDTIEEADHLGWKIARYTDLATLRRLSEGTEQAATFPDEIHIGSIQSNEINRSLATRGIDQRDVVRVSYDLLSEWLDGIPAGEKAAARHHARPLRSATRPYGESDNDHLLLRDYVLGSDPAARQLLSLISSQGKEPPFRPMKRSGDLLKCWTPPSPEFRRYAIVDGAVPGIVLELRSDEVPLQDLFVIDGDHAVPALFRSRVFAVWARATLPAASSWMARFSVSNTFGGFPIADIFRIVGQEGSLAALVADGAPSRLGELAEEVGQHIERALASLPPGSWKEAHRQGDDLPAMRSLNGLVLHAYGLREEATDIQILRRLKEMNAALGKSSS
jgi:hypothetical protein